MKAQQDREVPVKTLKDRLTLSPIEKYTIFGSLIIPPTLLTYLLVQIREFPMEATHSYSTRDLHDSTVSCAY